MKIRLKLPSDVSESLGITVYVLQSNFDFSSALLQAIRAEGLFDHLDNNDLDPGSPAPSPPLSTHSSPLSSPPSSRLPSPSPSRPSSPAHNATLPEELSNKQKRKLRRGKAQSKKNRKRQRQESSPKTADEIPTRPKPAKRFVPNNAAFHVSFSMDVNAAVASTSYVGLLDEGIEGGKRVPTLKELVAKGFTVIKAQPGATIPLAEAKGRVFGLAMYPGDPTIAQCAEEAAELLKDSRPQVSFTAKQRNSRRGHFGQVNTGVAHGGGRLRPGNISNSETNTAVLEKLIASTPFQRLSGYATGVFKTWAPRLYNYCSTHFESLLSSDASLRRIFNNSIMASAAFNFGPRTTCLPHIDFGNLPFLWCWIWALGWYDWKQGGHLVLWDLKIVIEFPPGALIAIPSGVCRHGNTAISRKETRYSFTQYSSGGNFRWVDHGFQTEEDYKATRTAAEAKKEEIRRLGRWEMGLSLLCTVDELGLRN